MKLVFALLLVVCCVLQYTRGSIRAETNTNNPAYPDRCFDKQTGISVPRGTTKYNNCEKMTCDTKYTLTVEGCQLAPPARPGCSVKLDSSKQFPDCCPKEVC